MAARLRRALGHEVAAQLHDSAVGEHALVLHIAALAQALHAGLDGLFRARRTEDVVLLIEAALGDLPVPFLDRRADHHQRLGQVDALLEFIIEGDEVEIGVPHADPLVHIVHRQFQQFPLPLDLLFRPPR